LPITRKFNVPPQHPFAVLSTSFSGTVDIAGSLPPSFFGTVGDTNLGGAANTLYDS
jgi:hypothetical protein